MESIFEALEKVTNGMDSALQYCNETRILKQIYGTRPWNVIRRNIYGTYEVDSIIEISEECEYSYETDFFCKHRVRYKYNGLEQTEKFSSSVIHKLCKQTNYPISSHFSIRKLYDSFQKQSNNIDIDVSYTDTDSKLIKTI
jgi:hypothetical protein